MSKHIIDLTILGLPKTTNGTNSHWIRFSERKKWHKLVTEALMLQHHLPSARLFLPRFVLNPRFTLTRYSSRPPDFDGLVSSFKAIIDTFKKLEVIKDDSMAIIGQPDYKWELAKKSHGRVRIVLDYELND